MSLSQKERDSLTQALQTGVDRGAERLSRMSGTEWGIMASSVNEIPPVRLLSWFTRSRETFVGVNFRTEVPFEITLLFPENCAEDLANSIIRPVAEKVRALPDWVSLTIGELTNVLAHVVVGSLAEEYRTVIHLSTPIVSRGTKGDLTTQALSSYDGRSDTLLMSHFEMFSPGLKAESSWVITADSVGLRKMLDGASS